MLNRKRRACWRLRYEDAKDSDSRKKLMRSLPTHRVGARINFVVGPPPSHATNFRYDLRGFAGRDGVFNIFRSYRKRTVLRGRNKRGGKFNSHLVFEIENDRLSRNELKNTGRILFLMKKIRNRRK